MRGFLGLGLDEAPPEHSTISRTRRLIDLETHRAVFTWILQVLATADLVKGKTIGIDATTLEANAALRSIVRRDSGETYQEFLTRLAQASGIETPTRADLARLDRKRPKKGRNKDWRHPHDPDARITKMKDGRTHLAHKAEHAVDMETGAIVGVTVQGADQGDTTTIAETVTAAAEELEAVAAATDGQTAVIEEVVADKGYHSNQVLVDLAALDLRTYIAEPDRGRRTLEEEGRGPRRGVCESSTHPRRARAGVAAATQRATGTTECASLRNGRDAAHASARPREHPETAARPRRRLQPGPLHADALRHRHAPQPARAACGGSWPSSSRCGRASSASGATAGRHPPITRPRSRRIIVSNCSQSARQKEPFNHGLLDPRDKISDTPDPEVYRFDGTETTVNRYSYSFRLVADALALTEKLMSGNGSGSFTLTTDAYSVTGDVLTVYRQLSSVTPTGHILVMQVPANNFRHTYIYRRETPSNP